MLPKMLESQNGCFILEITIDSGSDLCIKAIQYKKNNIYVQAIKISTEIQNLFSWKELKKI